MLVISMLLLLLIIVHLINCCLHTYGNPISISGPVKGGTPVFSQYIRFLTDLFTSDSKLNNYATDFDTLTSMTR